MKIAIKYIINHGMFNTRVVDTNVYAYTKYKIVLQLCISQRCLSQTLIILFTIYKQNV